MTELNNSTSGVKVSSPKATDALLRLGKLLQGDNVSSVEVLSKAAVAKLADEAGTQTQNDFTLDKEKLEALRGKAGNAYSQAKLNK